MTATPGMSSAADDLNQAGEGVGCISSRDGVVPTGRKLSVHPKVMGLCE